MIAQIAHTTKWFNRTAKEYASVSSVLWLMEQHWFVLSEQERAFVNFTFAHGGRLDEALAHMVNVRAGTGFTTQLYETSTRGLCLAL